MQFRIFLLMALLQEVHLMDRTNINIVLEESAAGLRK